MDFEGLREAVPPAYCEYIGGKALAHLTKHAPDVANVTAQKGVLHKNRSGKRAGVA
jgi:hypothetical protein